MNVKANMHELTLRSVVKHYYDVQLWDIWDLLLLGLVFFQAFAVRRLYRHRDLILQSFYMHAFLLTILTGISTVNFFLTFPLIAKQFFENSSKPITILSSWVLFGVKVDESVLGQLGVYCFRIHAEVCHLTGSLLPPHHDIPDFSRTYLSKRPALFSYVSFPTWSPSSGRTTRDVPNKPSLCSSTKDCWVTNTRPSQRSHPS